LIVVQIAVSVAMNNYEYREEKYPFTHVELRLVGAAHIHEQKRQSGERTEERRWLLIREGREPIELGRRSLHRGFFSPTLYRWRAIEEGGRVRVEIEIDDKRPMTFGEGQGPASTP